MFKNGFWGKLPLILKIILILLSIVTVVFWVFFLVYHIINLLRAVIHFLTEKKAFWVFIICIVICGIIGLLFAQFYFGLDPFGKAYNWLLDKINIIKQWLVNKLN